jgi:hypothetical protein
MSLEKKFSKIAILIYIITRRLEDSYSEREREREGTGESERVRE